MALKDLIQEHHLGYLFLQGSYGIEKEGQRIDEDGNIVNTVHPTIFGSRSFHPYVQTDFAESQLELITPPGKTELETYRWLMAIHDVVQRSLEKNEYLWPLSMPAGLKDPKDIRVAQLEKQSEVDYREYLSQKYGKTKQMISGIHYNFQLHPEFLERLATIEGMNSIVEKQNYISELYLRLTQNFFRYEWILTYLLGASPVVEDVYFTSNGEEPLNQYVRSIRNSSYGYVNKKEVEVSYDSLIDYVTTLEQQVSDGNLLLEKELYRSVRFRGATKARDLLTKGISYVEFRSFDINPYAAYGMTEEDMRFIHLFLVSLLWRGETVRQQDIKRGQDYKEEVAMAHPYTPAAQEQEGIALLKDMLEMLDCLQPSTIVEDKKIVEEKLQQFYHPTTTIAAKLVNDIEQQGDYQSVGLRLAKHYKNLAMQEPFALKGFKNLELSTQILMFDAIQKGIKVEVLDEHDQFLSLTAFDRVEYVKNGNMTSRDSISSYMAMANKVVTKKIIEKQGFHVPFGYECHTEEEALALYSLLQGIAFVIKPKSTNYGLGITIFKQTPTIEDYTKAIQFAFAEDSTILVEHFVTGTEYRFFVINGETKAVLLRKPAHVIGDGVHSIAELVEEKNKHPYRGYGHQAPLAKIELGDIEILLLKQQGFVSSDIPAKEQIVYLRENSNISTGGDSVDVTQEMDNSYKQLAAEVAVAMGAVVCGVDMMIEDYTQPATKSAHQRYAVIEANFNPAMMMQIYPEKGEGRRLTMDILQLLFPEIVKGASE